MFYYCFCCCTRKFKKFDIKLRFIFRNASMAESPEWLNQRIFAVLARFIPHLDEKAPIERLQSIFPHFRDCLRKILAEESVCEGLF